LWQAQGLIIVEKVTHKSVAVTEMGRIVEKEPPAALFDGKSEIVFY